MEHHRRHLERKQLSTAIPVCNAVTGQTVGELVNITVEGLMIIAEQCPDVHSIYQYTLQLPSPILGKSTASVGVDCMWTREQDDHHRHWAGFQIIDASPDDIAVIAELIANFGQQQMP